MGGTQRKPHPDTWRTCKRCTEGPSWDSNQEPFVLRDDTADPAGEFIKIENWDINQLCMTCSPVHHISVEPFKGEIHQFHTSKWVCRTWGELPLSSPAAYILIQFFYTVHLESEYWFRAVRCCSGASQQECSWFESLLDLGLSVWSLHLLLKSKNMQIGIVLIGDFKLSGDLSRVCPASRPMAPAPPATLKG